MLWDMDTFCSPACQLEQLTSMNKNYVQQSHVIQQQQPFNGRKRKQRAPEPVEISQLHRVNVIKIL